MYKIKPFFLVPLLCLGIFFLNSPAHSNPLSDWIPLATDSKDEIKQKIKTEVDKREGFSTPDEESANIKGVEGERAREDSAYKGDISSLTAEFNKYKKERDDLTAQFQNSSTDFEGLQKNIKTIKSTIENYDNDIARFEQDIKTQKESFTKWLKTEKQGETVVAVIYTRGFKDIAHDLEKQADQISSPLMAEQMGTYVKSHTTVIDSIVIEDFIQTITEGTAKWNGEEPVKIELEKGSKGTVYVRIKRYELYPFQKPEAGVINGASGSNNMKAVIIQSIGSLEGFLSKNGYSSGSSDLSQIDNIIRDANLSNKHAEEGLNTQTRDYEGKISRLKTKIINAKDEKELQINLLKKKEQPYEQMKTDIETLRKKREESEKLFKESQTRLSEKKRIRESIIIKTALVAPKGSQTPADASAEIIQDKLEEVKNDARTQHSSSTLTVVNYQLKEDTSIQAVTEAKIIALKLLSFINEGDSVKVKMAFRVRTLLHDKIETIDNLQDDLEIKEIKITGVSLPIDEQKDKNHKKESAILVAMIEALSKFGELIEEIIVYPSDKSSDAKIENNLNYDEFTIKRVTVVKDFILTSDVIVLTINNVKFEINEFLLKSFNLAHYNKFLSLFKKTGFEGEYGFYDDGTVFFNLTYKKSIILLMNEPSDTKVYINGTLWEKIPDRKKGFKAGQYKIEVKKDGFKTWTKTLKVEGGQLVKVKAKLIESETK